MRLDVIPGGRWLMHALFAYSNSAGMSGSSEKLLTLAEDERRMILAAGLVSREVVLNYSGDGYPDVIGLTPEIEVASDALRQVLRPSARDMFRQSKAPLATAFADHVDKLYGLIESGVCSAGTPEGPGNDMHSRLSYGPGQEVSGFAGGEHGLSDASRRTLQILGNPESPPLIDRDSEGWYVSAMGQDFLERHAHRQGREEVPSLAFRALRAAPIYIASAVPDLARLPTPEYLEWRDFQSPSIGALSNEIELRIETARGLDPGEDIEFLTTESSPLDDLYVDLRKQVESSTLLSHMKDVAPSAAFGTMVAGFQSLVAGAPLEVLPAVAIGSLSVVFVGLVKKIRSHTQFRSNPMYWRTSLELAIDKLHRSPRPKSS